MRVICQCLSRYHAVALFACAFILAVVPLSAVTPFAIKTLAPALSLLIGLGCLIFSRRTRATFARTWPVWLPALCIVLWAIANAIADSTGMQFLDKPSHIVLYLLIAMAFSRLKSLRVFWAVVSLGNIILGAYCTWVYFATSVERVHAPGYPLASAIVFAIILFALALAVAVRAVTGRQDPLMLRGLYGLGFIFAAYGGLLTGSRGPLLAFLVVLVVLAVVYLLRHGSWRQLWPWALTLAIIAGGGVLSTQDRIVHRFEATAQHVSDFANGTVTGSLGTRLEMWKWALHGFAERPWLGQGVHQYHDYINAKIAAGHASALIRFYDFPHNVYLNFAFAGGIVGLLLVLATFIMPIVFFARRLDTGTLAARTAAWAGLAITAIWALAGITENILQWTMSLSCFYFFIFGLAAFITAQRTQATRQ